MATDNSPSYRRLLRAEKVQLRSISADRKRMSVAVQALQVLMMALFCLSLVTLAMDLKAPSKSYSNQASGVRFTYPSDWEVRTSVPSYLPGPELRGTIQAVVFSGSGYPQTDFGGAAFLYSVEQGLPEERCTGGMEQKERSDTEVLGSTTFHHVHVEDEAMSHQRSDDLYFTSQNGSCYEFDLVLLTSGYGARDGIRRMSESERTSVVRQLKHILASVQLRK